MLKGSRIVLALSLFLSTFPAQARLQCVPYARSVSGIGIHGNAWTWWDQAASGYQRGGRPKVNSVLVFQATSAMPLGHVAVVQEIIDERHILLNHANWSRPGMIEQRALAVDISETGDWSEVRVWYGPSQSLGTRANPTFGFIYGSAPAAGDAGQIVSAEQAVSDTGKERRSAG
ncbi:MAG: CHAP domain-containing protein [Sphingobium sp.]